MAAGFQYVAPAASMGAAVEAPAIARCLAPVLGKRTPCAPADAAIKSRVPPNDPFQNIPLCSFGAAIFYAGEN
jgi:hypothetical protein